MARKKEVQDTGEGTLVPAANVLVDEQLTQKTPDIDKWEELTRLPRALMQGTRGMREAGHQFLPKHTLETPTGYRSRLERSTLLNAYRKTASYLAGQVFQTDIIFSDETPPVFEEWAKSIDSKKNALDVFAKRVFINGIAKGCSFIYIDVPKVDPTQVVTQADEQAAGVRPYFREIRIEDMIAGLVDESGQLVQVRFYETTTRRTGPYSMSVVEKIRVLNVGSWELHEKDPRTGKFFLADSGVFSVSVLPFVVFIPGEEWSVLVGEPPIMDLAELNAKHWRSSSDQDNILHVARVPILFGKNIELAAMPVGTSSMVMSTDDNADLKFVEVQGSAIAAGREDLKETEAQMALYGLQQLVPRTGNMTATEKALNSAESNSSLGTWTIEYESCLQLAFEIAGMFMKDVFPPNGIELNKEYMYGVADPQELAQILKAQEQGLLSAQAAFAELRRRGVLDEHLKWDDMQADLEQEKREALEAARMAGSMFDQQGGDDEEDSQNDDSTGDE